MARKETKEPDKDQLIVSKEEAKARLQKQIDKGNEITQLPVKTSAEIKQALDSMHKWIDFTKEVLLRTFNTDRMEQEYAWASRVTHADPIDNFRNIDNYLNKLKSILDRVDLYDDITVPKAIGIKPETMSRNNKDVFVVHGRNENLRKSMFDFLRSVGLNPKEWSSLILATGKTSPYVGEILDTAFSLGQAIIVLISGDDEARLLKPFQRDKDLEFEKNLTPQPRPNVLFEAGMAMGRNAERTILVQIGAIRPWSDVAGRHVTLLDNTAEKRHELIMKLKTAHCDVDHTGTDWIKAGNFEDSGTSAHIGMDNSDSPTIELDNNKNKESLTNDKFIKLEKTMPGLLREMHLDLINNPLSREFVVAKKSWTLTIKGDVLIYYLEEHPKLIESLIILENNGLLVDVTSSNIKRYRMTEEFADYLVRRD